MDNSKQNLATAIIVGAVGLFQFLSYIMPQIQKPLEVMISQLPPNLQVIAMGMVGIVLIVVYVWNYTSSIELAKDKQVEGQIEIINAYNEKKAKRVKRYDEP